jgi:hypothetical protein
MDNKFLGLQNFTYQEYNMLNKFRILFLFFAGFLMFHLIGCGASLPPNIRPVQTPGNVAFNAQVTASASYSNPQLPKLNFKPSCAVDGITYESHYPETYWLLPDYETGFISIDLPKTVSISKIRLLNTHNDGFNDRGTKDFHVDVVRQSGEKETVWRETFQRIGELKEKEFSGIEGNRVIVYVDSFFHRGGGINEIEVIGNYIDSTTTLSRPKPLAAKEDSFKGATQYDVSQKWAVIIGISNYRDTRIAGLRYASTDAKDFHNWLISPQGGGYAPSRVRLFLNSEATAQSIRNVLFNWLKQALEEDMITIYFAGHGSPESPDSPNNLFLLPFDANYDDVASTGFPMWDIETALKRFIKAKKVVVIADACHAGGVGQAFDIARRANRGVEINPISSGLQNLSKVGDGVAVISASDDKQYSQEGMAWGGGHGVFTYFLLKGLKGEADYNKDGRVTLGELIPYLSEQVRRETRNAQSPTVAGKFDPALSIGK